MKYFIYLLLAVVLISCSKSVTNPVNNTDDKSYFLKFTVGGKYYEFNSNGVSLGYYLASGKSILLVSTPEDIPGSGFSAGVYRVTQTGTINLITNNDESPYAGMFWYPNSTDNYATIKDGGATLTFNITSITGSCSGSFTGVLKSPFLAGSEIQYKSIDINGSFKVPIL